MVRTKAGGVLRRSLYITAREVVRQGSPGGRVYPLPCARDRAEELAWEGDRSEPCSRLCRHLPSLRATARCYGRWLALRSGTTGLALVRLEPFMVARLACACVLAGRAELRSMLQSSHDQPAAAVLSDHLCRHSHTRDVCSILFPVAQLPRQNRGVKCLRPEPTHMPVHGRVPRSGEADGLSNLLRFECLPLSTAASGDCLQVHANR